MKVRSVFLILPPLLYLSRYQVVCKKTEEEMANNWVFLDCLDSLPDNQSLSKMCETLVWDFKLGVSKQEFLLDQAQEKCGEELGEECK